MSLEKTWHRFPHGHPRHRLSTCVAATSFDPVPCFPCTFSPQFPLQFLALHPAFRFLLHQRPRLLSLSELSTQRLIISLEHHKCQQSAVSVSRSQNPIFHPDLNPLSMPLMLDHNKHLPKHQGKCKQRTQMHVYVLGLCIPGIWQTLKRSNCNCIFFPLFSLALLSFQSFPTSAATTAG